MKKLNRNIFISKTCELLEGQGYHGTTLNDVLSACNAQKGSLYYFFPEGKEELAAEAIKHQGEHLAALTRSMLANQEDSAEAIYQFIWDMATLADQKDFKVGAPFAAIAQESASTNERLRHACMRAYQTMKNVMKDKLEEDGFAAAVAEELAVTIVAAIDGAILLARTQQNSLPLRHTAKAVRRLIRASR